MQVQASSYSVLTHKSFPSLESGSATFFFCGKKWAVDRVRRYNGGKENNG